MPVSEVGSGELCVRNVSGQIILLIPHQEVVGLSTIDLKHLLLNIIPQDRTTGLLGLQLLAGQRLLEDTDVLEEYWPHSSSVFEISLILRKAVGAEDIHLTVSHLLSQLDQQNVDSTIERMVAIEITTVSQLEAVVDAVLAQSLIQPDNSQCYARIVQELQLRYPTLPSKDVSRRGRPRSDCFMNVLLNAARKYVDDRPVRPDADAIQKMSTRLKFLANLFGMELLDAWTVRFIVEAFVGTESIGDAPNEPPPYLDCVCDFIELIGPTLSSRRSEHMFLSAFVDQLSRFQDMPWWTQHLSTRVDKISSMT
eukprot:TRINITY_DN37326_c0_g1_i1.p1 TRINITY_DN37326_c0_g1~~TRINITY_DN37326_c0_g1_i1.p1  ORF type:complete len:310 (-),score=39.07 TRINITY_DN37326_c0_g1_i1:401-1330(-)